MHFLDIYTIAEEYLELINPSSPEKVLTLGTYLGLNKDSRVIDFGCGYGEALALWAERFGISGVGIELRQKVVERARKKMADRGFSDRIEIVCAKGAEYAFEEHAFDIVSCMGASFIWGGYRPTIRAMKKALAPGGKMLIGEPYWLSDRVPPEYMSKETIHTELELVQIAREEGFDFEYMVRADDNDWARYEAGNWHGLIRWLEANPDHPEKQEVIDWLHKNQDDYFRYGRQYLGWALYILNPVRYL